MGDRVSIQFEDEDGGRSAVLFNHWGGMGFVKLADKWAKNLAKRKKGLYMMPLDRLEAGTVMMDFVRYITKDMTEVESSLYIVPTESDGDNSDNGHHIIKLKK